MTWNSTVSPTLGFTPFKSAMSSPSNCTCFGSQFKNNHFVEM